MFLGVSGGFRRFKGVSGMLNVLRWLQGGPRRFSGVPGVLRAVQNNSRNFRKNSNALQDVSDDLRECFRGILGITGDFRSVLWSLC